MRQSWAAPASPAAKKPGAFAETSTKSSYLQRTGPASLIRSANDRLIDRAFPGRFAGTNIPCGKHRGCITCTAIAENEN